MHDFASWMYVNSHFAITTVTLAWIYLRRNERFYFVRNMFMVAMGIALVGYVALPDRPAADDGRARASTTRWRRSPASTPTPARRACCSTRIAAIPSMHVAFSLMLGVTMAQMVRRRWAKALWYAYSPVVTFVVIATANHWWIDGFLGAAVALVSAVCARELFARARPEVWAWNPQAGTALP